MVPITPRLLKFDLVTLRNLPRRLHNNPNHLFIQQRSAVFHRKHYVVVYLPCTMARLAYNRLVHPSIL